MAIKVFTTNSPQHAAPVVSWNTLRNALSPGGVQVYLNEGGEAIPAGYTPYSIAQLVKNGAVWVDWCGWPMYGSGGQQGFDSFLTAIGQSLPNYSFNGDSVSGAQQQQGSPPVRNKYERMLLTTQPLSGIFRPNMYAPRGSSTVGNLFSSQHVYWYSSFAVFYGKGAYVYAFGNDNQSWGVQGLISMDNGVTGVSPAMLIPFVNNAISQVRNNLPSGTTPPPSGGSGGSGSGSGTQGGGSSVYIPVTATLNGKSIGAISVNYTTYLSVSGITAQNLKPNSNGKTVSYNGQTYVEWDAIPSISVTGSAGNFHFTTTGSGGSPIAGNKMWLIAGAGAIGAIFLLSRRRG